MNTLDICIIITICTAFILGLWKGLIRQVFSLGGVIIGYIFAKKYYEGLSNVIPVAGQDLKKIVSFTVIFIFILIIASLAGWMLGRLLKKSDLDWMNRVTGGVLGFVKGGLIVIAVTVVLVTFLPSDSRLLKESKTLPYVIRSAEVLSTVIPGAMKEKYYKKAQDVAFRWKMEKGKQKGNKDNDE
ncbi:MAG: CvpA family protein [Nitrospiraceae bacterium]|nr:MAG: CvpA family protein [Nitrospiraceae bacterium]